MSTVQLDTDLAGPTHHAAAPRARPKSSSRASQEPHWRGSSCGAAFVIAVVPLVWVLGSTVLKGCRVLLSSTWWTNSQAGDHRRDGSVAVPLTRSRHALTWR